ncbi:DNA primase family protein [Myroides marinus]|uniref:DNA primase family protein n=1 Tax=Myroides marinus TaxID=703342 RepID=UPI002574BDD2|nr:phage/plasmid primase, P4 family [Myroides marinus]MDM1534223.1 DNA primase [Myroides marinus]MDM1541187.1 DNA primase [Myroides marinus]
MENIILNPEFTDLQNPDTFKNHINQLLNIEIVEHDKLLNELLNQFETIDFITLANPTGRDDFKISNKHYTVLAIENILKIATSNRWGLCKKLNIIYLYNGTYWNEVNIESFKQFLSKAAEKMGVPVFSAKYYKFGNELYEQFLSAAYLETKQANVNKVLINLNNGTFEINNGKTKLRPFNRADFLTYKLPFDCNKVSKAPMFETYLNKVLPNVDCQKVLAEYLGYLFIKNGNNKIKEEKALILYGSGANGKSVFFEIVSALLGTENTCNYSLQNLTDEKGYHRIKLVDKLVNYASEINGKLESATFKQLVSGEPVEARNPYGQPIIIKQYAKLIFNCNELPKDIEQTNAYFRRFLIIPFNVTIPKEQQDKHLHTKIIENELSGVFNWVLEGLNRLLEQGKFTDCEEATKALDEYRSQSDSVKMFLDENEYKPTPVKAYQLIKELYIQYNTFCVIDGYRPVNKTNFIKRLQNYNIVVKRINIGNVAYISNN